MKRSALIIAAIFVCMSLQPVIATSVAPNDSETVSGSVNVLSVDGFVTTKFASVGSEIVSLVQSDAFDYLDAPIKRINSADVPMPYSSVLEKQYLPQVEDIIIAIEEVCYI